MDVSAYRLIEGALGAILRQSTIECVRLRRVLVAFLSVSF